MQHFEVELKQQNKQSKQSKQVKQPELVSG